MLAVLPRESCAHQPVRQMRVLNAAAVGLFHGVLLDQHPLIAAVGQGTDERAGDIRVVGQRHLGGGESPDAPERLKAEDCSEMVLPGAHVQPEILRGRGGGHRVAPGTAEPLHGLPGPGITGEVRERIEYVIQTHLPHPMQQRARIVEHHPGLVPLVEQLPDELAHALVAPYEYRGIVVVADVLMVHHPRQIADDRRGAQVAAGRDKRLVHVQRDRERAGGVLHISVMREHRVFPARRDRLADERLLPAQVRQAVDVLGERLHGLTPRLTCAECTRKYPGSPGRAGPTSNRRACS